MDKNYLQEQFRTTQRREFSFTNDYVFKAVFGQENEKSKQALMAFLNVILDRGDDPIKSIKILNPMTIGSTSMEKQSVMDILAETERCEILNIEMQAGDFTYYPNRSLKYGGELIRRALSRGENYGKMKKSIVITVADGVIFRDSAKLHCRFMVYEKDTGELMTDRIEFHCIQLGAVDVAKPVDTLSPEEMFAAYLKFAGDENSAGYVSELLDHGKEYMEMTETVFKDITLDDRAFFEKRAHDIYLSDYATVKDMLAETKGELTETKDELHETKAELAEAREALADGKAQGKQLGEMRVNRLIKILGEEGRIDDILRAAEDSEFQEKLFKKYGL